MTTIQPRTRQQLLVGRLMAGGAAIASLLILVGLIRSGIASDLPVTRSAATGMSTTGFSFDPGNIVHDLRAGRGVAFIELGLLVLIVTPVIRVALTTLFFATARDRLFTALGVFVFLLLLLGLFGIGA